MLPTLAFLVAIPAWAVENPNADVAMDTVDGQGVVHVTDPANPAISLRTEFPASPHLNKQIRVSARLQADGPGGAAYVVVRGDQRAQVFHEQTRVRDGAWTNITVVADVPADATHIVLGIYQQAGKASFSNITVEERHGEQASAHADFVLRPTQSTGSHVARESWMRVDDSRVVSDGGGISFLVASLVDVKSLAQFQSRSFTRRY